MINIAKSFQNTTALDQVSFTVQPGEIFGFLGPSIGKTTTIKILTDNYYQRTVKPTSWVSLSEAYDEHRYENRHRHASKWALRQIIGIPKPTILRENVWCPGCTC